MLPPLHLNYAVLLRSYQKLSLFSCAIFQSLYSKCKLKCVARDLKMYGKGLIKVLHLTSGYLDIPSSGAHNVLHIAEVVFWAPQSSTSNAVFRFNVMSFMEAMWNINVTFHITCYFFFLFSLPKVKK